MCQIPEKFLESVQVVDIHSTDTVIAGSGPAEWGQKNSVFVRRMPFKGLLSGNFIGFQAMADRAVWTHPRALLKSSIGHKNDKSQDVGFSSSWFYFLLKKSYLQKVYINNLTGSELDMISWHDFLFFFSLPPKHCFVWPWILRQIFYTAYCTGWMAKKKKFKKQKPLTELP